MKRIHIVGHKNSGKTTLIVELVEYLVAEGLSVGTVKHTHHRHELDIPGKDSHRHRTAGAAVVGILTPDMTAVFRPIAHRDDAARYAELERAFLDCDVMIVEGDLAVDALKVEVWRPQASERPYAADNRTIHAVITDSQTPLDVASWPRQPIADVARRIRSLLDV